MKITLDLKSIIIGFFSAALLISLIQTGAYIIAPNMRDVGKVQWIKGDFYSTHKTGKDNKKEN
jgi:hypothetical protein